MLLLRMIVTLVACWIVKCDLLDLYVQHMDETMRTRLYSNKRHPMDPVSRRIKRSFVSPFSIGNLKKQRLDVDEESRWKQWQSKKKIVLYKNDALNHPNEREENLDADQHEMLSSTTQNSKQPEETSMALKDVAEEDSQSSIDIEIPMSASIILKDELESNSTQEPAIEKQKRAWDHALSDMGTDVEDLDLKEEIPEEDWENPGGMENDEDSQFEIISENERINPKPFDDPSFKRTPKLWGSRMPKKYLPSLEKLDKTARGAKNHDEHEAATRFKRSVNKKVNKSVFNGREIKFVRYEVLDENGDVILEWDLSDDENVTFRVTARTLGYVGIGFNEKSHMKGADMLLVWVDDHTGSVNILDSHGIEEANGAPVIDTFQDVQVLGGSQNGTHTVVTFSRKWETCDPQDHKLTGDSIRVLWALHQTDPELNTALYHGEKRGAKPLRLKAAAAHPPPRETGKTWNVKLSQFEVGDRDTIYWCKIFAAQLDRKHHMIGYSPLVEKANEDLVHHMTLYECESNNSVLNKHTRLAGSHCYVSQMPPAWKTCTKPILAWARGSKGEWLPDHVGIPIAVDGRETYYMLEVHYNNPSMKKVNDSSGIQLHLTPNFRSQEAGILAIGVAMTPFHFVPPKQKEYATAGYCTPHCTNEMFAKDGINIISVFLHSHLAGRRLSLKHIRQSKELPKIVQDNHFDFDYQQSHTLEKEVKVLPGDELVAECVYNTWDRTEPTLGGYAASQEMCLAFVMHYPMTALAGCFSMTSVKDFFKTFGVNSLRGVEMNYLEQPYLNQSNPSRSSINKTDESEDNNFFTQFVIEEPREFQNRTMAEHMLALPWKDESLTRPIEDNLYHGRHLTFCKKINDELAMSPSIQTFPNYTALPETNDTTCSEWKITSGSTGIPRTLVINLVILTVVSIIVL